MARRFVQAMDGALKKSPAEAGLEQWMVMVGILRRRHIEAG